MLSMTKRTPSSVKHRGGDVVLRGCFLGLLDDIIALRGRFHNIFVLVFKHDSNPKHRQVA